MSLPSRKTVAVLISLATLTVCALGIRAELNTAKNSIAEHRLQTHPAQPADPSVAAAHEGQGSVGLKDTTTP
jgi:hypothetical protein